MTLLLLRSTPQLPNMVLGKVLTGSEGRVAFLRGGKTVPGLFREVLKGNAFPFTIIVHISLISDGLERFMGEQRYVDQPYNP